MERRVAIKIEVGSRRVSGVDSYGSVGRIPPRGEPYFRVAPEWRRSVRRSADDLVERPARRPRACEGTTASGRRAREGPEALAPGP